jgi:hypothetical protein
MLNETFAFGDELHHNENVFHDLEHIMHHIDGTCVEDEP